MFLALPETDGQVLNHILVILQQILEKSGVLGLVILGHYGREVVEDVEGSDVELVDGKDGRIAAHDEGQGAEAGDAVGNADGKLLLEVLGASLHL